jgi:hypothetical protein
MMNFDGSHNLPYSHYDKSFFSQTKLFWKRKFSHVIHYVPLENPRPKILWEFLRKKLLIFFFWGALPGGWSDQSGGSLLVVGGIGLD